MVGPLLGSLRATWFRAHATLGWGLLADTSLVTLYGFTIPFMLAAVATVDDAGSFRLAQTLTGPATLVTVGAATQLLPHLVRTRRAEGAVLPVAQRAVAVYAAISAAYTAAVVVLPRSWGERIVGGAWGDARVTAIALAAAAVAGAIVMPALLLLRSASATTLLARTRLWLFPLQLAAVVVGAVWDGAEGAALGLAVGNWCSAPVWWWVALRHHRQTVSPS
jgi:O-antigen/teichoic acid export membrane protein